MASKKISQVRQEYYKQEQRIRNIVKREAKRGLTIDINQLLPPTPSRVTKVSVARLKEITPEKARHAGYVEYKVYSVTDNAPLVVPYRQILDEVQMYMAEQKEKKDYNGRLHLSEKYKVPYDDRSYPKSLSELYKLGAKIAYNQVNELEWGGKDKEIVDLHKQLEEKYLADAKRRREHPEYQEIDDLVKNNLEKVRERVEEEIAKETPEPEPYIGQDSTYFEPESMGDISHEAMQDYYDMVDAEVDSEENYFKVNNLPFEEDTIIDNLNTALSLSSDNPDVADFLKEMVEYRISELGVDPTTGEVYEKLGKRKLANIIKGNIDEIKHLVYVITFDSDSSRVMDASNNILSLMYEGDVPPMFQHKLDAINYINVLHTRSKKIRKSVNNYFKERGFH